MVKGKIVKQGLISEITTPVENIYKVHIKGLNNMGKTNVKRTSLKIIKTEKDDELFATFNDLESAIKGMTIAKQSGGTVLSMNPYKMTLEETFVELVNTYSNKEAK